MNKKQMESKKVNKNLSKKIAPLVMSTSMVAAAFLAAGAPISAAELDTKAVNPEVIEHVKNHGQEVSALAKSLPGSPEKGKIVSKLAQANSGTNINNDNPDNNDNIDETNNDVPQEGEISDDTATEETEAPTADDGQAEDGTEAVEEDAVGEETEAPAVEEDAAGEETEAPTTEDGQGGDSSTWVDETYEFIGDGYQSVIGYYQTLIEEKIAHTSEKSENVEAIDVVSDISADAGETDTTTLEADTSQDISVDNENTDLTSDTDVNLEGSVVLESEDQPSNVETPEQETVELVEDTVSDLEEPIQTVNEEVSLDTETEQMSQNEVEKDSDKNSIKDKLIGYYQDLAASFSNLLNFLK